MLWVVLSEVQAYVQANVDTDPLHEWMIGSGFFAAQEALRNDDDFWPGYVEGLTRVLLLLLGDYPDHRKRRGGAKSRDHYDLSMCRTAQYTQDRTQRFQTLLAAGNVGLPGLEVKPREILMDFRRVFGTKPTHRDFMHWFRKTYPKEYAAVFA